MSIVAREVVEKVSQRRAGATRWGSSAYYLRRMGAGQRIILEKNPNWRGGVWDFKANPDEPCHELIVKRQMKGKPRADRPREIYPIEEEQSRWFAFKNKQLDFINIPSSFIKQACPAAKGAGSCR